MGAGAGGAARAWVGTGAARAGDTVGAGEVGRHEWTPRWGGTMGRHDEAARLGRVNTVGSTGGTSWHTVGWHTGYGAATQYASRRCEDLVRVGQGWVRGGVSVRHGHWALAHARQVRSICGEHERGELSCAEMGGRFSARCRRGAPAVRAWGKSALVLRCRVYVGAARSQRRAGRCWCRAAGVDTGAVVEGGRGRTGRRQCWAPGRAWRKGCGVKLWSA